MKTRKLFILFISNVLAMLTQAQDNSSWPKRFLADFRKCYADSRRITRYLCATLRFYQRKSARKTSVRNLN